MMKLSKQDHDRLLHNVFGKQLPKVSVPETNQRNIIPDMTHELSSGWKQPRKKGIDIHDKFVMMSEEDFNLLYEYSGSTPSGVYEGKMWKSEGAIGEFFLKWFDNPDSENKCTIQIRKIVILQG